MNSTSIHYHGQRYIVEAGETLLAALLRQGAPVSYSCGKGSCHSCALKLQSGQVRHTREVDPALHASGHVLPCHAHPLGEVWLAPAELEQVAITGELMSRRELAPGIFELGIAPLKEMDWQGGQHLSLVRRDGTTRNYSIASLPGDDFLFLLHVRRGATGGMSAWLCEQAPIGEPLGLLPPRGDCHYTADMADQPLLLLSTGAGAGALLAVARQALDAGHAAPIRFLHGVRNTADRYLHDVLLDLERRHPQFRYQACLSADSGEPLANTIHGRVTRIFDECHDLTGTRVFLCGLPAMVEDARCLAIAHGVRRDHLHADPFDSAGPAQPRDAEKISATRPDPELWAALDHGPRLRRALESFYQQVYQDERLAPFFARVPIERITSKQYAFLADLFSGRREYFGLKPYNAHHWMVISDELFDHHEELFEAALRQHGLSEHLVHRVGGMLERFRAEIVKPAARGLFVEGREHALLTDEVEILDMANVCDGCGREIAAGQPARYQHRLGTLHCAGCANLPPGQA